MNRHLAFSLVANLALAGWWITRSGHADTASLPTATNTPAVAATVLKNNAGAVAIKPTATSAQLPAGIRSWKDLQSADLKDFVRRLRSAGCPEETIQDIILAEVN